MGSTNSVFSFTLTNTSKAFESMKEAHEKKKRAKLHMAIKFDKWCRYNNSVQTKFAIFKSLFKIV